MKSLNIYPALLLFLVLGCSSPTWEFTVTNDSNIARTNAPVIISRTALSAKAGEIPSGKLPLTYLNSKAIPSQVDDLNGDGLWDELAFTVEVPANSSVTIAVGFVDERKYPSFTDRTNVRVGILEEDGVHAKKSLSFSADELPVPLLSTFQMDGIAWENDKVGFRQYFDGRNGRDIFGKTSPLMALDTVGIAADGTLEDDYHVMLPWGRDILAVGNSLGLGGLAMRSGNEVHRLGVRLDAEKNNIETTSYELIVEGPVRSIFKTTYEGWQVGEGVFNLENKVTIWAGQYGYTNSVTLSELQEGNTLLVGVVNIHNDRSPFLDEMLDRTIFFTHDKQTYDKGWFLGMGVIFPADQYIGFYLAPDEGPGVTTSFLNAVTLNSENSVEYNVLFGWELSDERFADPGFFEEFMMMEAIKISEPVTVE